MNSLTATSATFWTWKVRLEDERKVEAQGRRHEVLCQEELLHAAWMDARGRLSEMLTSASVLKSRRADQGKSDGRDAASYAFGRETGHRG